MTENDDKTTDLMVRWQLVKEGFSALEERADTIMDNAVKKYSATSEPLRRIEYTYHALRMVNRLMTEDAHTSNLILLTEIVPMMLTDIELGLPIRNRPDLFTEWQDFSDILDRLIAGWLILQADYHLHKPGSDGLPGEPYNFLITFTLDLIFMLQVGSYKALHFRARRLISMFVEKE